MLKKFTAYVTATGASGVDGTADILSAGNPGRYYVTSDNAVVQPRAAAYNDGLAESSDASVGSVGLASAGVIVLGHLSALSATVTQSPMLNMWATITVEQIPEDILLDL
jgi:hypothetical protein